MAKQGKYVYEFSKLPNVISYYSVAGVKEGQGPLAKCFDYVLKDDKIGQKSWENAEIKLQNMAVNGAINKAKIHSDKVDVICSGDLMNQCIGSAYSNRGMNIPYLGLYGACSTMAESIIIASLCVESGLAKNAVAATSSHFCTAERQFRFPLEYGGQRAPAAQWTVTGSGAVIISDQTTRSTPKIKRVLIGKIIDLGIKDMANMGAAMAPAAADSLKVFFTDTNTVPSDYDLILTGDLGVIGSELLKELLSKQNYLLKDNYTDCGKEIYYIDEQDVHSGGSGCGCSASVLCGYYLPKLEKGELTNVLFCATGALMSPISIQQGETIPAICHIVNFVAGER